jgi:hypothetical protein
MSTAAGIPLALFWRYIIPEEDEYHCGTTRMTVDLLQEKTKCFDICWSCTVIDRKLPNHDGGVCRHHAIEIQSSICRVHAAVPHIKNAQSWTEFVLKQCRILVALWNVPPACRRGAANTSY